MRRDVDLLLLNCSNLPEWPIFPYAFVQVSALARRRGLHVERFDFLGLAPEARARHLRRLIERHRPRMIGLTIRQCDTQVDGDYLDPGKAFFPIEDSRDVIRWCRDLTDARVILGGFGFTSNAIQLFDYLAVVEAEVEFLAWHMVRKLWFVCSEQRRPPAASIVRIFQSSCSAIWEASPTRAAASRSSSPRT